MKKYLFGLLAIVFAIGAVAFTKPATTEARFADVYFKYVGPDFSAIEVAKPANWIEVTLAVFTADCNTLNRKACGIKVDDSDVQGTAPARTLKAATIIPTSLYVPDNTHFVTTGTDVLTARNKQ